MKQYKYLYNKCTSREVIDRAYKKLRVGKTKRKEIQRIDAHYEEEATKIQKMLKSFPLDADVFIPPKHKPKVIWEGHKYRTIYMPEIHEQWIHHIIIQVFEDIALETAWKYSCGSFPRRGAHYGLKAIKSWVKDVKATRYFLKFDIRHFYNNIDHKLLWQYMSERIKDEWFISLCKRCVMHFSKGLPLGFYISQWFANYFLEPLDTLITQTYGMTKYVRYMDDGVVFASNKKTLRNLVEDIKTCLGKMHLKLKNNWQICKLEYTDKQGHKHGRKLDFMGFQFDHVSVTLRKSVMISISRKARSFNKKGKHWIRNVYAMVSYFGYIKWADVYDFYERFVKPYIKFKKLRNIISKEQRRHNNDKLDNRALLC